MSNQQNNTRKNPWGTTLNQSNEQVNPPNKTATIRASHKDKPPAQSTPTKTQSAIPTPPQYQNTKQSAQNTPTACVARDKTQTPGNNTTEITTKRPLSNRDRPSSLFNPALTSTPRSSQMRDRQQEPPSATPLRIAPKIPRTPQAPAPPQPASCPPCPPCPRGTPQPQSYLTPTQTESGREICFCPVPPGSCTCIPRAAVTVCLPSGNVPVAPTDPSYRPPDEECSSAPTKEPETVKKERILKLEILTIRRGIYDIDKIHQQGSPINTPCKMEPKYDPCFDVDLMEDLMPATEVSESNSRTTVEISSEGEDRRDSKEKRQPVPVNEEDTAGPRISDESFLVRDALSKTESSITHVSSSTGPAAPRKRRIEHHDDDEYDVLRSAPAELAPFRLSDLSLTDVPPVLEKKEDETSLELPLATGQQIDLGDDYLPVPVVVGDETLPGRSWEVPIFDVESPIQSEKDEGAKVGDQKGGKEEEDDAKKGKDEEEDDKDGEDAEKREVVEVDLNGGVDGVETNGDDRPRSGTQNREDSQTTDRQNGAKTTDNSSAVAAKTIPVERTANEPALADEMTGEVPALTSIILGPSVMNFAHFALSPLTALRTFLGPATSSRPARKKRFRMSPDDLDPPAYIRMKSIRSAFLVTPYDAAASSVGFLLRKQAQKRRISARTRSTESESSSDD